MGVWRAQVLTCVGDVTEGFVVSLGVDLVAFVVAFDVTCAETFFVLGAGALVAIWVALVIFSFVALVIGFCVVVWRHRFVCRVLLVAREYVDEVLRVV